MITDAPPQSARPTVIRLTVEQHRLLGKISYETGDHQPMCRRIFNYAKQNDDHMITVVLATDMVRIKEVLDRNESGKWQDLMRQIFVATNK